MMNEKTGKCSVDRSQTVVSEHKEQKRTDPQRQIQKKTAVAALLMLVPFCALMYLIFGHRDTNEGVGTDGINTTIPDGKVQKKCSHSDKQCCFPNRTVHCTSRRRCLQAVLIARRTPIAK